MKRGFCLFLVAVLLAGLVPYAFADEAKPTDVSEDAAEPTEETTAPPETTVPSESTEPPSEATEPPVTTEATEPDADPVEDDMEDDRLLSDSISTYASTVSNVLLFDQASPNYTTVLKSQISVTYQPNGTDAAKTAYIKNLGWHFARYNNTPYEDDPIYCIEPCKNYAASTSGNYMDQDLGVSGSGSSRGSNVWYAMPSSYRQAIALTLLYSKQLWNSNYSVKTTAMANNPNVSTRIATQFLIYEIVTGLRDADTFSRKNSNGYTSGDVFYNAGVANVSGFADKYNSIVSSVQSAMKIPSFTSRSSGSAPAITMSGSQVSVTDSNGVLPADSLYTGEAPKTVTVVAGKTAEVSFLNKLRAGRITIRKVDTNDEPLAGATFLLEGSEDGSLWYPIIPGSNGVCVLGERSEENLTAASKASGEDGLLTWENLPTTLQYRITETKAPEGYTLLRDNAFVGPLPADNTEMELRVVNGEAFALPKTGSTGLTVLPFAVIFCFSICAGAILYLRKREI